MAQKAIIRFGGNLGYRLHPEIISPLLQILNPLRMFKIVFRDSSLIRNKCLFCLLWPSSASADRIGYITNFCSVIKLWYTKSGSAK